MFIYKLIYYSCFLLWLSLNKAWSVQNVPIYQAHAGNNTNQNFQVQMSNSQSVNNVNSFLEYYAKQNSRLFKDGALFFFKDKGSKLIKRSINQEHLKKAVVVFFGDWCPHCNVFLRAFAPHVELLRLSGVTTIFVAIPSIDKLRNWRDPNINEFNIAENKVASYNITLKTNRTFVTMIGDKSVLTTCGIEGLPVFVAVHDGKEKCRFVGEKAIQRINLSDPNVLKQFLAIWDEDISSNNEYVEVQSDGNQSMIRKEDISDAKLSASNHKKTGIRNSKKHRKKKYCTCTGSTGVRKTKVDWKKARELTEKLNRFGY